MNNPPLAKRRRFANGECFYNMDLILVTSKEIWDKQIGSQKQSQFLQSWEWAEFQGRVGRKFWRLDLAGEYILVIQMPLPLKNSYLYIPRASVNWDQEKINVLRDLAKSEKCLFIKIEPLGQDLVSLGFKPAQAVQPKQTLILDLTQTEEQLTAQLHQKTRYNIKLAAKKGVKMTVCREEQFPKFYDLLVDTFRRKDKKLHTRNYYQKLTQSGLTKIFFAEYEGRFLVANLMAYYGDTATYLHGGSSQQDKNIMAPHLLQWELILQAKARGYKYYDFWGIDEKKWPGVTRFKKGFGGSEVNYSGAFDLPVNKFWYLLYKVIKNFR